MASFKSCRVTSSVCSKPLMFFFFQKLPYFSIKSPNKHFSMHKTEPDNKNNEKNYLTFVLIELLSVYFIVISTSKKNISVKTPKNRGNWGKISVLMILTAYEADFIRLPAHFTIEKCDFVKNLRGFKSYRTFQFKKMIFWHRHKFLRFLFPD